MTHLLYATIALCGLLGCTHTIDASEHLTADGENISAALVRQAESTSAAATTYELYLCGKGSTMQSHTGWLEGDGAHFSSDDGKQAHLEGGVLRLEIGGESINLTLESSVSTRAGLYDSNHGACRAGVIVHNDGSVVGAGCPQRAAANRFEQVTPMRWLDDSLEARLGVEPDVFRLTRLTLDSIQ